MSKIWQAKSVLFSRLYSKDTISGVHVDVSPGIAETLVRRDGIINHHLIAYSLSHISAKNYQNSLICIELIVCNISVVFLRHSVDTQFTTLLLLPTGL